MNYQGDFAVGATVRFRFHTFDSTGASVTMSGYAVGDVQVYKDGNTTQRSSTAGYTADIDFDGVTGVNLLTIDTSDNTVAGFYAAGHEYDVIIQPVTIDGVVVRFWAGAFSIERAGGAIALLKDATIGLAAIKGYVDTEIADIQSRIPAALVGGRMDVSVGAMAANVQTAASIASGALTAAKFAADAIDANALAADALTEIFGKVFTTQMTESYAAVGVAPTLAQAIMWIHQQLQAEALSGTTLTVKKLDGSTAAGTMTVNNGTTPTTISRTS